jgi:hypothetical protein
VRFNLQNVEALSLKIHSFSYSLNTIWTHHKYIHSSFIRSHWIHFTVDYVQAAKTDPLPPTLPYEGKTQALVPGFPPNSIVQKKLKCLSSRNSEFKKSMPMETIREKLTFHILQSRSTQDWRRKRSNTWEPSLFVASLQWSGRICSTDSAVISTLPFIEVTDPSHAECVIEVV